MFIHNINPTLFSIGPLEVRFYGLVYVATFLLALWYLNKHKKELEINKDQIDNLIISLFLGLLIGARIFHFIFSDTATLFNDPLEIFKIWNGGMSFFGALVGMIIAASWYLKRIKLNWLKFADIIVIIATFGLIFGRIANFVNGELVGTVSNLPWCVVFPSVDQLCRHPYQIYAALAHVLLLGILFYIYQFKRSETYKDGTVFGLFIVGYSVLRIITDFFRVDPHYFGLTIWQWISFITIGITLYFMKEHFTKKKKKST